MRTRRFARYEVDLPLTLFTYWGETPVAKARGRCQVLAEGGLRATIPHDLYVGEVVSLELPRIARIYASVRSTRGHEYGFEFAYMNHTQRRAVRRFCIEQAADS